MSREATAICSAYYRGRNDRMRGIPYKNPFNKNKERFKHNAYKQGYYE